MPLTSRYLESYRLQESQKVTDQRGVYKSPVTHIQVSHFKLFKSFSQANTVYGHFADLFVA